jgi:hypothetical protein
MSEMRHYQGIDFEVWEGQQTWFWLVVDPQGEGGAIGAAANQLEAVRDACWSIEEMSMHCGSLSAIGWEISLANLERYLAQGCDRLS